MVVHNWGSRASGTGGRLRYRRPYFGGYIRGVQPTGRTVRPEWDVDVLDPEDVEILDALRRVDEYATHIERRLGDPRWWEPLLP